MSSDAVFNRSMNKSEWFMLLSLSVLWGGSFFFVGVLIKHLPPITIVFLRVGLAAVLLNGLVFALGMKLPGTWAVWRALFGMGLLNNAIPFCLIAWGQGHIASALAAILNATTPISTVIIAHFFTVDEKITAGRLLGAGIGFLGVIILVGPDSMAGVRSNLLAQLAVVAAAVCYAFAGVYGRRFRQMGIDPILTATGQVTASAVLLSPVMMLVDRPWQLAMPDLPVWTALAGMATLSTALGYVLYFRLLATAGATNLLLVTLLIPVSAIVMGTLLLGEQLERHQLFGFAIIASGLAVIDGRLLTLMCRPAGTAALDGSKIRRRGA